MLNKYITPATPNSQALFTSKFQESVGCLVYVMKEISPKSITLSMRHNHVEKGQILL